MLSLPARGVWIEILVEFLIIQNKPSHSPQGECGLKFSSLNEGQALGNVTPRKGSVD